MAEIILTPKAQPQVPIEADLLTPDDLQGKALMKSKRLSSGLVTKKHL